MNNRFSVNSQGKILPIDHHSRLVGLEYERKGVSLEGVLAYELDSEHKFLVNSFTDSFEIVDLETYKKLEDGTIIQDSILHDYYSEKFPVRHEGLFHAYQEFYRRHLEEKRQNRVVSFILVTTYTCNMSCIYCYQKGHHNKKVIEGENLKEIFSFIERVMAEEKLINRDPQFTLEFFGGEPFQVGYQDLVREVLTYARDQHIQVVVATNGYELEHFTSLLDEFSSQISRICTTLDGDKTEHDKKRIVTDVSGSFGKITANILNILKLKIPVTIAINVDRKSASILPQYFLALEELDLTNNDMVCLEIGRVDDRMYETGYPEIFLESELLLEMIKYDEVHGLPGNIRFAFLKTALQIAQRFKLDFNSSENGRAYYHYCWNTSPVDKVYYIDPDLDVFRCTYSVGNKKHSIGNLRYGVDESRFFSHNYLENEACRNCEIGTY